MRRRARIEHGDRETEVGDEVLARLAYHELAGPLLVQSQLLVVARERLREAGCRCDEVDLAAECAQEMLAVLDVLSALLSGALPRPTRLDDVLHGASRGRGRTRLRLTGPSAAALVDGPRTGAVVSNLLQNAELHGPKDQPVQVRGVVRSGRAVLDVRQHGGVPAAVIDALTCRHPPAGRHGLGLWLVRRLTEQMNGCVRYGPARDGHAWTFQVTLPTLRVDGTAATPAP